MAVGEAVVHVEGFALVVAAHAFVEHDDVGLDLLDASTPLLPEIQGNGASDVAAEAVEVEVADKLFHVAPEMLAQFRVAEVKLRKGPLSIGGGAVGIALHKSRVALCECRPRVEVYEVGHRLHAVRVRRRHKRAEVVLRAVLGVDAAVVGNAVGVAGVVAL